MPWALSFMECPSLACGGTRADLVVRAVAADLVARSGLEAPGPDPRGREFDGLPRLGQVILGRDVAARETGFEEAQLDARRQPPRHLLLGERVDLELETVAHALIGRLLLGHVA